jgi:hypothetical protein
MFTWVPKLVEGYNRDCMNIDEGNVRSVDLRKRLTIIQNERARTETQMLGFTSEEHDNMQEFYNREIKKNDASQVIQTVEFMFKDIKNQKLARYFIEALTKHVPFLFVTLPYRKR